MRGASLLVALAMAVLGRPSSSATWAARALSEVPDGFDHILHRGAVESRALDSPPCTSCHTLDGSGYLRGRLDHSTCFGACHGAPPSPRRKGRPYAVADDRREVCGACHAESEIDAWQRGRADRSRPTHQGGDSDFAIHMSHEAHATVAQGCRTCHSVPPDDRRAVPSGRPHARCVSCHIRSDATLTMNQCDGCHQPSIGPRDRPFLEPGAFPVGKRFSHRTHLGRSGGIERCDDCHRAVAASSDNQVPAPSKARCQGCHDGQTAFSTSETACRRCHAEPSLPLERPTPERAIFDHREHSQRSCADCHDRASAAGDQHLPCSEAGCHQPQFARPDAPVCTICHSRTEPWLKLHRDPRPRTRRDFGVDFSHQSHASLGAGEVTADCQRCHVPNSAGRFGPSRGHAACTGEGCHDRGQAPAMSACDSCHRLGAAQLYEQTRQARRWSVRSRFRHTGHFARPDGTPLACTACHTGIATAASLADIAPPAKLACADCHDGGAAFKLTGHTCQLCHLTR